MSETTATDYRSTLNLPKTAFPMKADLPKREPERVAWWREQRVYERRLERNAANPPWILHDGPPYANGEVHMGTFLNRTLKDIFVKNALARRKGMRKFVPGWDMHGLPIEFETLKHLKLDFRTVDPIELRAKCRERALHWLDVQRETFLRIGLLGDYESIRIAPLIKILKRRSLRRWPIWRKLGSSIRVYARRFGAFTTKRPWLRPRSNIKRSFLLRSTCAVFEA